MKWIWTAIVSVMLGLWAGYNLGYHRGLREERAAWQATEQVEQYTDDKQFAARYRSPAPAGAHRVKVVLTSELRGVRIYYEDPHSKPYVVLPARHTENVPDPRSMPVK
jgi:hypothetical protein